MLGAQDIAEQARQKAFRRLVAFLFVCFVVAYLDRVNIGFAALSMNKDLGLTAATFGLANTIFYLGYLAFEVPSNMMMARVGARRWIARIMITWGFASVATILAVGPLSLYSIRLLVGIAEAGFLPGVLLYLTYWFPNAWRGRATATFLIAQPIAIGFGSLLSGAIMSSWHDVLGLSGWQWLFILEGLPAVVLGIVVYFYLPDGPADAKWLSGAERSALAADVAAETPASDHSASLWKSLWSPGLIQLCVAYFGLVTSLNALATWSPLIIREVLGNTNDIMHVGMISAIPGLVAAVFMPLLGFSSDKSRERRLHYVVPVVAAAVGWLLVILADIPSVRLIGLIVCTAAGFGAMTILWTIPPSVLSDRTRPVGIAIISMCGISASVTSPAVIGLLRDATGSFSAGLWYAITMLAVSVLCVLSLPSSLLGQTRSRELPLKKSAQV